MDQPLVIVLDVKQQVRALNNMLKFAPQLKETKNEIIKKLVHDTQIKDEGYQRLLDYVAGVRYSQQHAIPQRSLDKVTMAIGDLGVRMIETLEQMKFYETEDPMPYYYDGLNLDGIVMHREQTINER